MLSVKNLKNCLQSLSDEYAVFQVGTLSSDNIYEVLRDPERYIREQILANIKTPEMAGFAIKKEILVEQLELPDFGPIKKLAIEALRMLDARNYAPKLYAFEFDEQGQVSVWPGFEKEITEEHSVFAETGAEKEIWNALQNFKNAWEQLDQVKHEHLGVSMPTWQAREVPVVPGDLLDIKKQFSALQHKLKTVKSIS